MTTLFGGVCVCVCVTGVLLARGRNQNTTTHNKSMDACHDDRKWTGRIMAYVVQKNKHIIPTNPHKCLYRWKTTSTSKLPYMSTKHRTHNKACMCSGTKDSKIGRWVTISLTTDRPTDSLASRSIRLWSVVSRYNNIMIERERGRRNTALSRESRYEHLIDDITRLFEQQNF